MKPRTIITVLLLAFVAASVVALIVKESRSKSQTTAMAPAATPTAPVVAAQPAAHKVITYYFHRTVRCETCRAIEAQARAAVEAEFADALKNSVLEWHVVNVEETGNERFVKDYQLTTPSLVLVDSLDAQQVRWTKLSRVWELVHTPPAFAQYVQNELRDYLGEP